MTKLYQQSSLLNKQIWGNPTAQFYLETRILKKIYAINELFTV